MFGQHGVVSVRKTPDIFFVTVPYSIRPEPDKNATKLLTTPKPLILGEAYGDYLRNRGSRNSVCSTRLLRTATRSIVFRLSFKRMLAPTLPLIRLFPAIPGARDSPQRSNFYRPFVSFTAVEGPAVEDDGRLWPFDPKDEAVASFDSSGLFRAFS